MITCLRSMMPRVVASCEDTVCKVAADTPSHAPRPHLKMLLPSTLRYCTTTTTTTTTTTNTTTNTRPPTAAAAAATKLLILLLVCLLLVAPLFGCCCRENASCCSLVASVSAHPLPGSLSLVQCVLVLPVWSLLLSSPGSHLPDPPTVPPETRRFVSGKPPATHFASDVFPLNDITIIWSSPFFVDGMTSNAFDTSVSVDLPA